jgi:hypothetical protein
LTGSAGSTHCSQMRFQTALMCGLVLLPTGARAQAPAWANLWRVTDGTLVRPAALGSEPTAAFWNPAAVVASRGPAFTAEIFQTPDVVNVSAVLLGASYALDRHLSVGMLAGRLSVGDLVRTTTSPASDVGDIQVYSQFAGTAVGLKVGPVELGVTTLLHDARLDGDAVGGFTVDLGLRFEPLPRLVLGAATHMGDPLATHGDASQFVAGASYAHQVAPLFGLGADVLFRYGLTLRASGGAEHLASAGLLLLRRLAIDGGVIWSEGYGTGAWQPLLGLAFRAGAYHVGIARGNGVADVGAAYRVTLGVGGAW